MIIENVNIGPLIKAFKKFEAFRLDTHTEHEKAGTIHAFEFCFELTWKVMKKLLQERGKIANSPKEVFRMAALEGFIDNLDLWFDFLQKRNLTTHTYEETEAEKVLQVLEVFSLKIREFLQILGVPQDAYGG